MIPWEFGIIDVTNGKKGKGPVHGVQGIGHHPRTSEFQTSIRHCDVDQHRISTYHIVTYVYKSHDQI